MRQVMRLRVVIPVLALMMCFGLSGCADKPLPPAYNYGMDVGYQPGYVNVREGDTVYAISRRYKVPMRDIIAVNNLTPPFLLKTGERLKLPPPREYTVQQGDTLYGLSRTFDVSLTSLARFNGLRSPYYLHPGQVIRLPASYGNEEAVVAKTIQPTGRAKAMPVQPPPPTMRNKPPARVAQNDPGAPVPLSKPGGHADSGTTKSTAMARAPVTTAPAPRSSGRFLWPVNGRLISGFGGKKDGSHNDGINIGAPRGTPVKSAENGVVVYTGDELRGFGNLVLVRHADGWMTAYGHLDKVLAKRGDKVTRGQAIGTVGSSGSVSSPQLHFEIRRGTKAVNPVTRL